MTKTTRANNEAQAVTVPSSESKKADKKLARAAAIEAIEFDNSIAHALLIDMAKAKEVADGGIGSKEEASIEFCRFAASTVVSNTSAEDARMNPDRDTVTRGFCKHMDAMLPMLAAEGSPFVNMTVDDQTKDAKYAWKGHGANVKSIAKGVTEYFDTTLTDSEGNEHPAIIDVFAAEIDGEPISFSKIKKSVQIARQSEEDDEAKDLREAKEQYREVEAKIRKLALGQKTAREVREVSDWFATALEDWADSPSVGSESDGEQEQEQNQETDAERIAA